MIDQNIGWVQKVNEIKKICADASLPLDVEVDKTPYGIDGIIELGDVDFEKDGDVYNTDFAVLITLKINKSKWQELLSRMMLLSQKLSVTQRFTIQNWLRIADDSDLIYQCTVIIKGMVNSDLLS